jgi:hypothetical protein
MGAVAESFMVRFPLVTIIIGPAERQGIMASIKASWLMAGKPGALILALISFLRGSSWYSISMGTAIRVELAQSRAGEQNTRQAESRVAGRTVPTPQSDEKTHRPEMTEPVRF